MARYFNNTRPFQLCLERLAAHDMTQLQTYFNVPSEKVDGNIVKRIEYSLTPSETLGIASCTFTYSEMSTFEKEGWQFLDFPEEIERVLYSYLQASKSLTFQIDCTNYFPIRPPKVTLTGSTSKELSEILTRIGCKIHSDEWSPALGLDCTLIILLSALLEGVSYV